MARAPRLAESQYVAVKNRLTCPDSAGELKRTSAAADGRSCQYHADGRREDVTLSLLPLDGAAPATVLAQVETSLRREVGAPASGPAGAVSVDTREAGGEDRARVDLPGLHINAAGDHAQVKLLGLSINADGDHARIHAGAGAAGDTTIDAGPAGAVIRTGKTDASGTDATFILASDAFSASGYKAVGYMARGPAFGPLVVAVFKSGGTGDQSQVGRSGVGRLLDLNARR